MSVETIYRCDLCRKINKDEEEYKNQILFVNNQATERKWNVCESCLGITRDFLLDNQEKNVRNTH